MAGMTREQFVSRYGGVYEHSAWVAELAFTRLQAESEAYDIEAALAAGVNAADRETKLALIRAHPDLAGQAAVRGELTDDSTEEQKSAGIDQCTVQEFAMFQALNEKYKAKFGFPFVVAVRGRNRQDILRAFAARLENDPSTEFDTAIHEIHKIARLRLDAIDSRKNSHDWD